MNSLEQFLKTYGTSVTEAMNLLQEHGLISDNCVDPSNVTERDCCWAIQFLEGIEENNMA